jgi:hypothetical protein
MYIWYDYSSSTSSSSSYSDLLQETASMFPWHKIKTLEDKPKEEERATYPVIPFPLK